MMMDEGNDAGVSEPIAFSRRFAQSATFSALFDEGMALVEDVANYLDGEGRGESHGLSREASLAYASESMRLTTRLMQIASWLLLQRAVNDGEMSEKQATQEKAKVRLRGHASSLSNPVFADLPERLRMLIERSVRLQERVVLLDDALSGGIAEPILDNPVRREIGRLARAFGAE